MDHPFSCGHPVHGTRPDFHFAAYAVAVHDGPLQKVGERGEADMGVGQYIQVLRTAQLCRSHVVDKHKGTHRPFHPEGEEAPHPEVANIGIPFGNDQFNVVHRVSFI